MRHHVPGRFGRVVVAASTAFALVATGGTVVAHPQAVSAAETVPCLRVPGLPPMFMPFYMLLFYVDVLLSLLITGVFNGQVAPRPGSSDSRCVAA